jgi:hypothetical protein
MSENSVKDKGWPMTLEKYPHIRRIVLLTLIVSMLFTTSLCAQVGNDGQLNELISLRTGMASLVEQLDQRNDLFPADKVNEPQLPLRADRLALWESWQAFLDHVLAFDTLTESAFSSYQQSHVRSDFRVAYASFLAQYRYSLDFITLIERNPAMHVVLNEPVPEIGLPAQTYARLKSRFLNVLRGADFARLDLLYKYYGADPKQKFTVGLEEDRKQLWRFGNWQGPKHTAKNALQIVQDLTKTGWMPVQKGVAEWMGDTKVWRPKTALISQKQIAEMQTILEPGDVLLVRREWYLSNIGLPGFWPHAAIYVGTAEERRRYFDAPIVKDWVVSQGENSGDLERLLKAQEPVAYQAGLKPQEEGHVPRVLEAISEGVSWTTLEHSAEGDSLVVLRPRLPKTAKARAILRAFHYTGRPYDFDFDFRTDASLVCTELVVKAYEADAELPGLELPLIEVMHRPVTPANEFARHFDETYDSDKQQFDMIRFLDGEESSGSARLSGLEGFRQSWQRPKWHILTQRIAQGPK